MFKPTKIYPRDLIAIITLLACFTLMALGINHLVSGIIIMVVTFYFARRTDGEGEPEKDINEKVKKLETQINEPKVITAKFGDVQKPIPIPQEPFATGDFKVISTSNK